VQAEDGIRGFHVTGVQTCALPIFLLLIVFWIWMMRRMQGGGGGAGGGVFNVGKSKAQLFDKDSSQKVTFRDVAGLSEAKEEVQEIGRASGRERAGGWGGSASEKMK